MPAHRSGAIQVHGFCHQIATTRAEAHTAGTIRLITTTMHARTNPTQALATHDIRTLFLVTVGDFTLHHPHAPISQIPAEVGLAPPHCAPSHNRAML